jgi:malonyl-CoA/methylmalonyl-CoA synthetase
MSFYARLLRDADTGKAFLDVPGQGALSYADVLDRAGRMATVLRDLGAAPATRVMVQVDKSADAVALYLAVLQTGAVYVPLNPAYTPTELRFFTTDAAPAVFIARPEAAARAPVPVAPDTALLTLGTAGTGSLAEAARSVEPLSASSPRTGDQVTAMLYTSGTTGRSKGAMLTSDNLVANAESLFSAWGWRTDDVLLHLLPIFHTHGLFVALGLAMMGGSTVEFHDRFDVDATLAALPRVSVMMGVPTYYHRLLASNELDETDLRAMRLFTSGSAPLSALVHTEFEHRTGQRILERYGMTETGMLFSNPLDGERVAGTVGFALPGVQGRVADDDDVPCRPGAPGMVQVRGANVFAGYWQLPEKTAAEFTADGFFRTGDIGTMDDTGRLTLAGRSSDMIISGGLNVYPKEVELVLDAHPLVVESAVIGVPHPDFGEAVVAVVVAEEPLDSAILDDAAAAALAGFKRPKHYEVVESLPRNAMGKVQKGELRARLAELFAD